MQITKAISQQIECIEERVAKVKRLANNIDSSPIEDTKDIHNQAMSIISMAQVLETMCQERIDGKNDW